LRMENCGRPVVAPTGGHTVGVERIVGGGAYDAPRASIARPYKANERYRKNS